MSSLLIAQRDANTCSNPQNLVNIVKWQLEYKKLHDPTSHFSHCRNEERMQGVKGRLFHQNSLGRVGLATAFCPQPGPELQEALSTDNKVPWVWNGPCAIMGSVTRVQFEL